MRLRICKRCAMPASVCLAFMGLMKMIYDITDANWNLCVRQAAEQARDRERSHGCEGNQMDRSRGLGSAEDDLGTAPVVHHRASQEPMYIPEMSNTSKPWPPSERQVHHRGLPETIFYFKSGDVYHTELGCRHTIANAAIPIRRRLCVHRAEITQRRMTEDMGS